MKIVTIFGSEFPRLNACRFIDFEASPRHNMARAILAVSWSWIFWAMGVFRVSSWSKSFRLFI